IDAGLRDRLYRADAVAKFSDGLTELDKQMAELKVRPQLVKFGGKVGDDTVPTPEAETAKVKKFAEDNPRALKAAGKTAAEYVAVFTEAKKKKPELTAGEFGIPDTYAA